MSVIALFDKSFLQSLNLDESVWFDHFFMPVVCPLFYVETLADLEKPAREGRKPEDEVQIIAAKFPDRCAVPCLHHTNLAVGELMGHEVPMDGRVPLPGGRYVEHQGKLGVIYDDSLEAEAFSRWQDGRFKDIEHGMAKRWRRALGEMDLEALARDLREIGVDQSMCKSLQDVQLAVQGAIAGKNKPFERMRLATVLANAPRELYEPIVKRWSISGYPSLLEYAPYVSHIVSVELFFQFALASQLIGTSRASNRIDVGYLNYLPFCMIFVSSDKLHRKVAPFFLRDNQEFVWGPDLKRDLALINEHLDGLPDSVKRRGIMAFARRPPKIRGSLVRHLRARFLRPGYDDDRLYNPPDKDSPFARDFLKKTKEWESAPTVRPDEPTALDETEFMTIKRRVRKKKGSWWQLPSDLSIESEPD